MPYLPPPPSQPPAIVQTLLPEETSSDSLTTSTVSKSEDRNLLIQREQAPAPEPNSSASTASLSPPSVQTSSNLGYQEQAVSEETLSSNLSKQVPAFPTTNQSRLSSSPSSRKQRRVTPKQASLADSATRKGSNSSFKADTQTSKGALPTPAKLREVLGLPYNLESPEQNSAAQSPSVPNFWKLAEPSHALANHSSDGGNPRELLEFQVLQADSRVQQILAAAGNSLAASGLASDMSLESGAFSSLDLTKAAKVENPQSTSAKDPAASTISLLKHYGFDWGDLTAKQLTDQWLRVYPSTWVRSALIEALYQGRYKAASVEGILATWQRRGQPVYHFDQEFERLVCDQLSTKPLVEGDRPSETLGVMPANLLEVAQTSPVPNSSNGERSVDIGQGDEEPLELYSDRQEYDDVRQIFKAVGNVLLRFRGATLRADQLQVNVRTQIAVAEGNVSLTRGEQRLQGNRLEYNFGQNRGSFLNATGEIYLPTASTDISTTPLTDQRTVVTDDDDVLDEQSLTEEIQQNQPQQVRTTSEIQRLRFTATRIEFDARGWQARDIRITNDPFSPPELEVRADEARLVRVSPLEDRVEATRPRLVFDQGLSLPILRSRVILDRQQRDPAIAQLGFDDSERGGFFIGRTFEPLLTDQTSLTITPQFFIQRAIQTSNFNIFDPDLYGLNVRLNSTLGPRTSLRGSAILTSIDPTDISDNLRASLRLGQAIETPIGTHTLGLEYAYRDRVYNGSLGFQDVQSSLGAVLTSPTLSLGNTGIELDYQLGTQYITAETERSGLADPASLGRLQASASLRRAFYLWQGEALPATATAGLRYTPEPVVPYLQLYTRITGITNTYTSGDNQQTLLGKVGLQGQFGRFSRPFLDYTGFNISYSQVGLLGLSPFIFDRVTDFKVLSAGIVQQLYGPIRVGAQLSLNLDTGESFDTEYLLEYSRRTYGVILRYNPSRQGGSINFRLNGFNWAGGTQPFLEPGTSSLEGGNQENND